MYQTPVLKRFLVTVSLGLALTSTSLSNAADAPAIDIDTPPTLRAHTAWTKLQDYQAGAAQGQVVAKLRLGDAYLRGIGTPPNRALALYWFNRAAHRDFAEAQQRLSELLFQDHDNVEALSWLTRSAQQGYAPAQFQLGKLYGEGTAGVPQDFFESFNWLYKAALQDHAEAQFALARMYEQGSGITRNVPAALRWYKRAVARGNTDAVQRLKALQRQVQDRRARYALPGPAHPWSKFG